MGMFVLYENTELYDGIFGKQRLYFINLTKRGNMDSDTKRLNTSFNNYAYIRISLALQNYRIDTAKPSKLPLLSRKPYHICLSLV